MPQFNKENSINNSMNEAGDIQKGILQDYACAVITLLWCFHEGKRKLIFSSIELFPNECVEFYEIDEQSVQVKIGKTKPYPRMFYRRVKLPAKNALELYKECIKGSFEMIWETDKDKDENPKRVICSSMRQVPKWPVFTLSRNIKTELCPFLSESWGMCRVHHLMSEEPDSFVVQLVAHEKSLAWMKDRLLWDIHEFPELIGSVHLILPNPVYRYIEEKLIPNEDGKPEQVRINFTLRKAQTTAGLKLITAERQPFGVMNIKEYPVNSPEMKILLAGKAEEFATAVFCERRGLLEYTNFGNFVRAICINMGIIHAIREVNLPDSDESYQVPLIEDETININDKVTDNIIDLGQKLTLRAWKKEQEQLAEKLNQHLFLNDMQKKATEFIAGIIQSARQRVIIVDPYFATMELYKYIFRIASRQVEIEIITSTEILKEKNDFDKADKYLKKGQILWQEIKKHEESISKSPISVYVMTGTPLIHDRFLVADDQVWFSGNSLNHIGERASMIIKLANPDEVLELIDDVKNNKDRVKTLEEWANNCESDGETDEK